MLLLITNQSSLSLLYTIINYAHTFAVVVVIVVVVGSIIIILANK